MYTAIFLLDDNKMRSLFLLVSISTAFCQISPAKFASCIDWKEAYQNASCCKSSHVTGFMVIEPEINPADPLERLSKVPENTPFYALNLIKVRDEAKLLAYLSFASASLPMFGASGTNFGGRAYSKLIGPQQYDYDFVAIAYYPNITMFSAYAAHLAENIEMSNTRVGAYYYQENLFVTGLAGYDLDKIMPSLPMYTSCEETKTMYKGMSCCESTRETNTMVIYPEIDAPGGMQGFANRLFKAPDGVPIYALNLFKFKDIEQFKTYGAYSTKELAQFGASGVFAGNVITKVIGPQEYEYDAIAIVYYPNTTMFYAYAELLGKDEEMKAIRRDGYYYQENIIFDAS